MNKSIFKRCSTISDLRNNIELAKSYAEEHMSPLGDYYAVKGTDLPGLRYQQSTYKDGYIHKNFFSYTNSDNKELWGIAECDCLSDDIRPVLPAEYLRVTMYSEQVWTGLRKDGRYDLYLSGQKYEDSFVSTDILQLGGKLLFLQVDNEFYRSLVCIDADDMAKNHYEPTGVEDFKRWFDKRITKNGYDGSLDNVNVSDIFRVYFEVVQCIFIVGCFKALNVR